jgi:hypothetical protein
MDGLLQSHFLANMCQPCPRTPVSYLSGLNTKRAIALKEKPIAS